MCCNHNNGADIGINQGRTWADHLIFIASKEPLSDQRANSLLRQSCLQYHCLGLPYYFFPRPFEFRGSCYQQVA